ncbi:hypothetical protein HZB01_04400 [Candidatus Woesearchaeota archaeon]|nr:hypothetical protein [Candidatus Woesearchaeota archaeon]
MTEKRGQVTLFIIIGVLLLLIMGFGYYLYSQKSEQLPPEPITKQQPTNKISSFVESCIDQTASEAVIKLGSQGGYINLPPQIDKNPTSYLALDPYRILRVPFWYYAGEDRSPTIPGMQDQLASEITKTLPECLNNFTAFSQEYTIKENADIQTRVTIAAHDVRVSVSYILDVEEKATGEKTKLTTYNTILPVKLRRAYELAKAIADSENTNAFLENKTMEFITLDPKIPLTHLTFHCGTLRWRVADIKKELQTVLQYNYPRIKIKNTNVEPYLYPDEEYQRLATYDLADFMKTPPNVPEDPIPEDAYEYFHFQWDVGSTNFKDLTANVIYEPSYGMDMKVSPSSGGIMKSNVGKGSSQLLSYLCINMYHFVYGVVYPVQIAIREDTSFNGEGFVFRFAMPVIIDNNEANKDVRTTFNPEFTTYENNEEFCGTTSTNPLEITVLGRDGEMPETELPYVNLSYECLQYACNLGKTTATDGHVKATGFLPQGCSNGYLVAEKEGYLTTRQQYVGGQQIELHLEKTRTFNLSIVKSKSTSLTSVEPLSPDDVVFIQMSVIGKPYEFEQFVTYPEEDSTAPASITLVDGSALYDINIILSRKGSEIVYGGFTGNWTADRTMMKDKNTLQIKVVEISPAPALGQEAQVFDYLNDNQLYKQALQPAFITTG